MVANEKIRLYAKKRGVKMWQIADALQIAESTLCRRLRKELTPAELPKYISAIDQIAQTATDDALNRS